MAAEWVTVYCDQCSNATKITKGQEAWCARNLSHKRNEMRRMKEKKR